MTSKRIQKLRRRKRVRNKLHRIEGYPASAFLEGARKSGGIPSFYVPFYISPVSFVPFKRDLKALETINVQ